MKYAAVIFLLIASYAGFLGFAGISSEAVGLAKAISSLCLCLSITTTLAAVLRGAARRAGSTGNRRELFSAVP